MVESIINVRADIDYAYRRSTYYFGRLGIKVWIMKGEVYEKEEIFRL